MRLGGPGPNADGADMACGGRRLCLRNAFLASSLAGQPGLRGRTRAHWLADSIGGHRNSGTGLGIQGARVHTSYALTIP